MIRSALRICSAQAEDAGAGALARALPGGLVALRSHVGARRVCAADGTRRGDAAVREQQEGSHPRNGEAKEQGHEHLYLGPL